MSKRSKGHGQGGRGGYGEAGGGGSGNRRPTETQVANTGKLKSGVAVVIVKPLPKGRK